MTTIHPAPKLVHIWDDGDGGAMLRITAADGTIQVLPLTVKIAAWLARDLNQFIWRQVDRS